MGPAWGKVWDEAGPVSWADLMKAARLMRTTGLALRLPAMSSLAGPGC